MREKYVRDRLFSCALKINTLTLFPLGSFKKVFLYSRVLVRIFYFYLKSYSFFLMDFFFAFFFEVRNEYSLNFENKEKASCMLQRIQY